MNSKLIAILDKVQVLFTRYGIKSMTMDDIARETGITKKTLYQYIQNKDDLVKMVVERIEENHKLFFKEIQSRKLNAIQSLMWVSKLLFKMFREHNPSFEFDLKKYHPEVFDTVKTRGKEKLLHSVKENLRKGKEEGLYRKNLNEDIITKLYVGLMDTVNENCTFSPEEILHPDFLHQLMEYHVRGVANERGLKLFNDYLKDSNYQILEQNE